MFCELASFFLWWLHLFACFRQWAELRFSNHFKFSQGFSTERKWRGGDGKWQKVLRSKFWRRSPTIRHFSENNFLQCLSLCIRINLNSDCRCWQRNAAPWMRQHTFTPNTRVMSRIAIGLLRIFLLSDGMGHVCPNFMWLTQQTEINDCELCRSPMASNFTSIDSYTYTAAMPTCFDANEQIRTLSIWFDSMRLFVWIR